MNFASSSGSHRLDGRSDAERGTKQNSLCGLLSEAGMTAVGALPTSGLTFHDEVRTVCAGNSCGSYNSCWACPPAVGTLEECRARCETFDTMLLFSRAYQLEDAFDFEGMVAALADFKRRAIDAAPAIREAAGRALVLSNEGCGICPQCTWPDEPCRFPEKCLHSLEGYGLVVSELAQAAGVPYNNGPDTVTFFGAVLFGG